MTFKFTTYPRYIYLNEYHIRPVKYMQFQDKRPFASHVVNDGIHYNKSNLYCEFMPNVFHVKPADILSIDHGDLFRRSIGLIYFYCGNLPVK